MKPQELRDMADFYTQRPAVSDRDPLTTEMSVGECQNLAITLSAAADEIERLTVQARALATRNNAITGY